MLEVRIYNWQICAFFALINFEVLQGSSTLFLLNFQYRKRMTISLPCNLSSILFLYVGIIFRSSVGCWPTSFFDKELEFVRRLTFNLSSAFFLYCCIKYRLIPRGVVELSFLLTCQVKWQSKEAPLTRTQ